MLSQADDNIERALDVRTLMRVQSLIKTLLKVLLDRKHLPLLRAA